MRLRILSLLILPLFLSGCGGSGATDGGHYEITVSPDEQKALESDLAEQKKMFEATLPPAAKAKKN